jgi:hypothetical protein
VESVGEEKLLEDAPAPVLGLAAGDAVGDGEDGGVQTSSFVFCSSVMSVIVMPLSIAFAMS